MRILSSILVACYIAAPNLIPLLAFEQASLCIQYGNTFASPLAYTNLGFVLCEIVGDVEAGYKFGQLALNLLSRTGYHSLKSRTLNLVNQLIIHHKEHLREVSSPFLEGYQSGLETGDLEFAAYNAFCYCSQGFFVGKELVEVEREMAVYGEAIRQLKQETVLTWLKICHQSIFNLIGDSVNPTHLVGEFYSEIIQLPQYEKDKVLAFFIHFNKLFLGYLFSEYVQAVENTALVERCLLIGAPSEPVCYLYTSLARLVTYSENSTQAQEEILRKVAVSQEKMERWAHHAPMNYLHKYHLVEAEKARVLGQFSKAEELYEQAIQGARENQYLQEEALAYELAAKHYLARGREKIAQLYMKEAHYCYERWGAIAKVKDLEIRYPQLFPQSSNIVSTTVRTTDGTTSNTSQTALDLATVMKASQAISSEIELEKLLRSLMQILIENAGAQTGYLLLDNAGEWTIEAACELRDEKSVYATQVLQSAPMINRLCEPIVQYVIRSHELVILNDATREGKFINDPYLQRHKAKSVLCLPLLNQSKLVGVLYLENQLATGVFTPTRSQLLNLLSTQAAIAIENARLYAELRASKSQMTQFLEAVPVGIAVFDAVGRPYYFNQRATQLAGKGSDPSIDPNQLSEIYQVYVAGTKEPYPFERLPSTLALNGERTTVDDIDIHQNDAIIPVEVWGTPVFDEEGNVAYAIAAFQDITERKQAEKLLADYNQTLEQQVADRTMLLSQEIEERQRFEVALRQSEEQRRLTMDFTYIGSWNWHIIENTVDWNDNHARLLGLVPGEVESCYQAWRDRVHPEDIERVEQAVAKALETHNDFEAEYRVIHPDGSIHWLVGRGRGIYNEAGEPVRMLGVILDISDRKRAEEASILEERNRMAREIHDTLAQAFTGILLHVGALAEEISEESVTIPTHLETIDELARTGLSEARRSVAALRPKLLEEGSLFNALKHLTTQMSLSSNTNITYKILGAIYALPANIENHLLRIGQEALTNAIKYARATQIDVELVCEENQCVLRIKDNGQGFDVDQVPLTKGFGLLGMSERVEQIGGELVIQSQPSQGTEVIVVVSRGK